MSTTAATANRLSADQVLSIAHRNAERVYKNLDRFRVSVALEADGWHVEFDLKDPQVYGGGPRYRIDPTTGEILHKVYYQ